AAPLHPTEVRVASLEFEGGEVPHAEAVLNKLAAKEFAECASEHGGSRRDAGMEIRVLGRAPGKAEGIDVGKSKGVPGEVGRCIVAALAGKKVGAPSTEPVGVTLTLRLVPSD